MPPPPWRKPVLLVTAGSLLTLGLLLNLGGFGRDSQSAINFADDETWQAEPRFARFEVLEDALEEGRDESKADEAGGRGGRHKGEEGKMGKPESRNKSGLYAMKGASDAVPQMARQFDPDMSARNAGLLGVMQEQSGHFLASPHGGGGQAFSVGGLGLVGTGRGGGGTGEGSVGLGGGLPSATAPAWRSGEGYEAREENAFVSTRADAKSTFSIDVDTASYSNVRRFLLRENTLPPPGAVRTEELVNYFEYDYARPAGDAPFSVTTEVGPCPWAPDHRLVHVGIQGKDLETEAVPPRNLVFLIDVSGSMQSPDKLPLVKNALTFLVEHLDTSDRVSIVVYAGAAGVVLPPTSGADKVTILEALSRLESGGGTNGSEGIYLAYDLARQAFIEGGINRVVLATDGDFNLGVTSHDALIELIEDKRKSEVFLSVLGFGTGNLQDHTMEQIADKGNGNYAYIDGILEARKVLVEEASATLVTIAKDVKIQVEFDPDQIARHRLVGYENRVLEHHEFDDDTKDAGEIGSGHTVTALYEVVPAETIDDDAPIMSLAMRYKAPRGQRSRKIVAPVLDGGATLHESSEDFRFSAAVAAFGQKLRGSSSQAETTYAEILAQAETSMGADPHCYRHQFLELVFRAGELSGESVERTALACTPGSEHPPAKRRVQHVEIHEEPAEPIIVDRQTADEDPFTLELTGNDARRDWTDFVLQTLRLLPPLLALPLFVMAFRKPRRRRRR